MFKYKSIYKGRHETLSINIRTGTLFFYDDYKNRLSLKEYMELAGDCL